MPRPPPSTAPAWKSPSPPPRATRHQLPHPGGSRPVEALARHRPVGAAVDDLLDTVAPSDFNPVFLLVGDRASLFAIDMARGDPPRVRALPPGLHVLENRPIRAPSPKVRHVRELLGDVWRLPATELEPRLESLLRDHEVPPAPDEAGGGLVRPAEVGAACVHTERYGTR